MVILDRKYTVKELYGINSFVNGFVKGVVDLDKEFVAGKPIDGRNSGI